MSHKINKNDCIGCSACSTICPVFAISGEKPHPFSINEKRCVDCGVCARVCPKSAIQNDKGIIPEKLKRDLWPKPKINKELCSACGICTYWCTPEAIGISEPKYQGDIDASAILLNPDKCTGCGLCERHCPLDAIAMGSARADSVTTGNADNTTIKINEIRTDNYEKS